MDADIQVLFKSIYQSKYKYHMHDVILESLANLTDFVDASVQANFACGYDVVAAL